MDARYEFRCWPAAIDQAAGCLAADWTEVGRDARTDRYLLSPRSHDALVKLREGTLDIKRLVARARGLERWRAEHKLTLPLTGDQLMRLVFPALRLAPPELEAERYGERALLETVVARHPDLHDEPVAKSRQRYARDDCLAEVTQARLCGRSLGTIAIESEDPDLVRRTVRELGLDGEENINYGAMLRRFAGADWFAPDQPPRPHRA